MQTFARYLFREWFRQVGEALLLAFLVTTFVFTTVGVVGNSMNPNLQWGERVFVPKYETWLVRFGLMQWRHGEVAIVKPPEGTPNAYARFPLIGFSFRAFFIKRIIGVPGDEVSLREGVVYLNGKAIDERHITDKLQPYTDSYPIACYKDGQLTTFVAQQMQRFDINNLPNYLKPAVEMLVAPSPADLQKALPESDGSRCATASLKLKEGYYYMMGDNRSFGGSEDSRTFGPVPATAIAGRANAIWWPLNKIRRLPVPEGFKQ
jgi:signal peptidase I